uniref:T cell leukemia/lymphoma 1B n=1 Tax=Suricata suricatta TaxID=37032 RepID=A0A673U974_SURSU
MASGTSPFSGAPPEFLQARRPGIYEDENGRTWVAVVIRLGPSQRALSSVSPSIAWESSITVHLWQMPVHPQEPMPPSQLSLSRLPFMWLLYSRKKYKAADTRFWEIASHGQVDSIEELVLTRLPGRVA